MAGQVQAGVGANGRLHVQLLLVLLAIINTFLASACTQHQGVS